jgi:hypothetical protein
MAVGHATKEPGLWSFQRACPIESHNDNNKAYLVFTMKHDLYLIVTLREGIVLSVVCLDWCSHDSYGNCCLIHKMQLWLILEIDMSIFMKIEDFKNMSQSCVIRSHYIYCIYA